MKITSPAVVSAFALALASTTLAPDQPVEERVAAVAIVAEDIAEAGSECRYCSQYGEPTRHIFVSSYEPGVFERNCPCVGNPQCECHDEEDGAFSCDEHVLCVTEDGQDLLDVIEDAVNQGSPPALAGALRDGGDRLDYDYRSERLFLHSCVGDALIASVDVSRSLFDAAVLER